MAVTKKEKSDKLSASAAKSKKGDFKIGGYDIVMLHPAAVVDDNLHLWLSVDKNGEELIDDPHFVIVNPPLKVHDGTYRDSVDAEGNVQQVMNFVEDADAALKFVIETIVKDFLVKRKKI
jgi:hypothetical protein